MKLSRWLFSDSLPRRARQGARWSGFPAQVEQLESRALLSIYTVTSALDVTDPNDGLLTLREAITAANATTEHDTIVFNIGTGGEQTIRPTSALPFITRPLTIDGASQPGFAGTPLIELDGSLAGSSVNGLYITGGGSTIRGLVINRFRGNGILIASGGGNLIEGNFIGTDRTGSIAQGNWQQGIRIDNSANNRILGNTISGNVANGLALLNSGSTGNIVRGNKIGTNAAGTAGIGNSLYGLILQFAGNNFIGGPTDGDGNVISANRQGGMLITGSSSRGNYVQRNWFGTGARGLGALGNVGDGIRLANGANTNTIGGSGENGNVIAFNSGNGLIVADSTTTGNALRGNAVHSNSLAQFDPGPLGCACTTPMIVSAEWNGSELRIVGAFEGAINTIYHIDIFLSSTTDPSTFVGGQQYLFSIQILTDQYGEASFDIVLSAPVDPGQVITATASTEAGSCSLFSAATVIVEVAPPPPPPPEPVPEPIPEPVPEPGPAPSPAQSLSGRVHALAHAVQELIRSGDLRRPHARALLKMLSSAEWELGGRRDRKALVSLNVAAINLTTLMRTGRLAPELGQPLLQDLRDILLDLQSEISEQPGNSHGPKNLRQLANMLDNVFNGHKVDKLLSQV